jgi:membrane-bound lytic murein transglycosylase B
MVKRASIGLIAGMLAALLAACATPVSAPPVSNASTKPDLSRLVPLPEPEVRPEAPASVTDPALPLQQRIDSFVAYTSRTYGVDAQLIRDTLAQAQFQQPIIDAISRPAEKVRAWADYRPIFMTDARIEGGRDFYRAHRDALERIAAETGVPAEYIVAIIGVETSYGRITGNYRVLDALYTLTFGYPKRAPFFGGELAQLFAMGKEEGIDIASLKGSYAGAMGWGQFMPSSFRLWSRDGNGDGDRDLAGDTDDIFASIANYFVAHGWQGGAPVAARAQRAPGAADFTPDLEPAYTLADLARRGYSPLSGEPAVPAPQVATLVVLEGAQGREYWIGYRNFYVITRYNHSPMYAMAVHQLAQAIRAGVGDPGGA